MDLKRLFKNQVYGITCFERDRGRGTEWVVKEMLKAGIKIIQYREKHRPVDVKYDECVLIRELTRKHNALFIVNDDVGLAALTDADGVHLGQDDLPLKEARKLMNKNQFIGISTHSPRQAREAVKLGADYIGAGPVFRTQTKEGVCGPVGVEYVEYVAREINLPFVAIGGIKEHNVAEVIKAGAECVALVTEITEAENIQEKVKAVFSHLR